MRPGFVSAPFPLGDGSLVHRVLLEVDGEQRVVWNAVNAEQAEQLVTELNRAATGASLSKARPLAQASRLRTIVH
jgi:hypothetical protein